MDSPVIRFFEQWQNPRGTKKILAAALIALLLCLVWLTVYITGGIKFAYAHFVYIPILLSAIIFGKTGAISTAVLGGLILGPVMPVDTVTGEQQLLVNWLARLLVLTAVGCFFGFCLEALRTLLSRATESAHHDPFTDLPNQNGLKIELDETIAANVSNGCVKLLIINLDNYIDIFYTFGHEAANRLLSQVYNRLGKLLPQEAGLYQIQTNKFSFVINDDSCDGVLEKALVAAIRNAFQNEVFTLAGVPLYVEISTGIAAYPEHARSAEELIQKAGIALYTAKQALADYSYYDAGKDWTHKKNAQLLGSISEAINQEQFTLFYQPQYDIYKKRFYGAEALVRWKHPEKGLVMPGEFLPELETTALIHPFTKWVLSTALEQLKLWHTKGYPIRIAVNISAKNLKTPELIPFLKKTLADCNLEPQYLELEITESAVILDYDNAVAVLSELRKAGIRISLDDFGTGLNSLTYLKDLPIDGIKIDRSFICTLDKDPRDRAIVEAATAMAKSLGLTVTAEGVEDGQTLILLRNAGCRYAQGYYLYHPLSAEDMTSVFQDCYDARDKNASLLARPGTRIALH